MDTSNSNPPNVPSRLQRLVPLIMITLLVSLMSCTCLGVSLGKQLQRQTPAELRLHQVTDGSTMSIWLDLAADGVFTPTLSGTPPAPAPATSDDQFGLPPFLNDLADKGYVAIRVPHAPPTYTASSLLPGIPPLFPDAATFAYYSPPNTTTVTTVPISTTRWITYESLVNDLYPIADGHSHWEVWRLPPGAHLPMPSGPFRLKPDYPAPLELSFRIDFGADADANSCIGCPVQVLVNNGYTFIGPFTGALGVDDNRGSNLHAGFGPRCGEQGLEYPTVVQYLSPTVPFTHVLGLENYDTVPRTFTITAASTQGWTYTYAYRTPAGVLTPVTLPFTVTTEAAPSAWPFAGCANLYAVGAPSITLADSMRETLIVTATSIVSPTSVQATGYSLALAPAYQPNELSRQLYLPLILK